MQARIPGPALALATLLCAPILVTCSEDPDRPGGDAATQDLASRDGPVAEGPVVELGPPLDAAPNDAACHKAMNDAVAAIRKVESAAGVQPHIISVQGTGGWARRMDYYVTHPITAGGGKNIVYEVHVYDPSSDFAKLFINPAKTLPLVIGEFGPHSSRMTTTDCTKLMDEA